MDYCTCVGLHYILTIYPHHDNNLCNRHIAKNGINCNKWLPQIFAFMLFVTQTGAWNISPIKLSPPLIWPIGWISSYLKKETHVGIMYCSILVLVYLDNVRKNYLKLVKMSANVIFFYFTFLWIMCIWSQQTSEDSHSFVIYCSSLMSWSLLFNDLKRLCVQKR